MKKISQILIDSQDTRKQITGGLVKNWDSEGKPKDYCALGALACENGMINDIHDVDNLDYSEILESYGINFHWSDVFKMPRKNIIDKGQEGNIYSLTSLIYKLNDSYEWSFKQIGKHLKKLEDEGLIKYKE